MPITLPNIYATPQDVVDYVGIEALQLREDDRNFATGQSVTLTAPAVLGATSLTCAALQYPLLGGNNLIFTEASLAVPATAVLSAPAAAGATSLSVVALAAAVPNGAIAIDNGANVWVASLANKGCKYGTAEVKRQCCNRYNDSDLVNSWSVNNWTTIIASRWVCKRVLRQPPTAIEEDYQEVKETLRQIRFGVENIEDIGTRTSGWPFLSNVTLQDGYSTRKIRVEPTISEPTVTQYAQAIDWNSIWVFEW